MTRTRGKGRRWMLGLGAVALLGLLVALPWCAAAPPSLVEQKEVHMPRSNTLIIYYSRTGTTARVASAIAQATGADVEPLRDTVDRGGAFGFIRSLWDAGRRAGTTVEPIHVDPTAYELVVVGTPNWGSASSAPVRTFLQSYKGRLPQVAFFLTDGETGHEAVFKDMATLAGREPVAKMGVPQKDVLADRYAEKLAAFLAALPKTTPVPAAPQVVPVL